MTDGMPTGVTTLSLDEIVQALKSRAGFDVMFPEGPRKAKIIEFVSRLTGPLPDAYDILGAGVYLEAMRVLRDPPGARRPHRFHGPRKGSERGGVHVEGRDHHPLVPSSLVGRP